MRKPSNNPRTISFEPLEPRVVMSASTSTATSALLNLLYSIDGTGNNQTNTNWVRREPAVVSRHRGAPITPTAYRR